MATFEEQQADILKTRTLIQTQETQLRARREVINQQLREGGKGQGDIERYNRERDAIDAKLTAIGDIRSKLGEGLLISSTSASQFIESEGTRRLQIIDRGDYIRKQTAKTSEAKEARILELQAKYNVPKGIARQMAEGKTSIPKTTTATPAPTTASTTQDKNILSGWINDKVYIKPEGQGQDLPPGASAIYPAPYYTDPIQTTEESLAGRYRKSFSQSVKEGWVGQDGYQFTDTFNLLGGIQGGISYFTDTYGGTKAVTIPNTAYPRGGTGVFNPETGEYDQPMTDTFTRLRADVLLNPDIYQPAGQVTERKKKEVVEELTPKYESLASGATTQAEIDALNKQFQTEATQLYGEKIKGLDVKRQAGAQRVYEANVNAPSGLITTGALIGASFIGGIPAVTASYLVSGQGLKTGFEGAREGDVLKTGIGALQFGLGGYYGAKGTANLVTQSRIRALQNVKPSYSIGTRTIKGNVAIDDELYIKTTQYGTGTTRAYSVSKLGTGNTFSGFGMRSEIINVKDVWSGKNIILQNTNIYASGGKLLPTTSGGWTPSIYFTKSTGYTASYFKNTLRFDTTPIKSTAGAGRTYKLDGYTFSQSGSNAKITSKDIRFSGDKYFKDVSGKTTLGFSKQQVSLLKLSNIKTTPGSGSGNIISTGSKTGTQTFTNINQVIQAPKVTQIPKVAQVSKIQNIAKAIGGVSVTGVGGVASLSNIRADTIQIPKVDTTPAVKTGLQLKTIPATKTIISQAPALAQLPSTQQIPAITQIPAVTQIPAQRIAVTQIQLPFTGQLGRAGSGAFTLPTFSGTFIPPLFLPPIGADIGQPGKRRIQARKITAYTPSFGAIAFGVRGAQPKGTETGLRIRPVTKGFSFAKIFKRARKVRI